MSVTYADNTTEQWHYDAGGNVSSYKNRAGNTQAFNTYDQRNRPTGWSWSDNSVTAPSAVSFDYAGQCTQLNNSFSVLTMAYDDSGALKSEQQAVNGASAQSVTYTPDADGHVASVTYPDGEVASWPGLDGLGRVQQVAATFKGATSATLLASCGYTGERFYYSETSGGVYNLFGYQANGRVSASTLYHASGANITNRSYGFHPNGQLSWMEKNTDHGSSGSAFEDGKGEYALVYPDGGLSYWGNEAAGVASAANSQGDSEPATNAVLARQDFYEYDPAGNRTNDDENGVVQSPSFDGENRQAGVSYDANGNATSQSDNGYAYTFAFNAYHQLISASGGGHTASFAYDGLGRLCARTIDGATSYLYYAGSQVVEKNNPSNAKVASYYYYGAGGKLACRTDAANNLLFYHYDARGEVTHVSDGSGTVQEQYLYAAFGEPYVYDASGTQYRGQTSAVQPGDRFLWKGGYEWYPEIGLYRCGARFYSPAQGSFLQTDPIGQAGGINLYAYCGNDPINGSDPSGLDPDGSDTPKQSNGYDDGDGNTADSEDPRDANGIVATGDTPTGSHIPSVAYTNSNAQGVILIASSAWSGSSTIWQSSPAVTALGGLSYVTPWGTSISDNNALAAIGVSQGKASAIALANSQNMVVAYPTQPDFVYDFLVAVLQKLEGGDNIANGADLARIAGQLDSPPDVYAYSQGTLNTVEAVQNGMQASSITFHGSPVSLPGAISATNRAGGTFGGYNMNLTDPLNLVAPSFNLLGFGSGLIFNIHAHESYPIYVPAGGH